MNCLPVASTTIHSRCFWWGSVLLLYLVFCVVFYCFVCLRSVSCVPNVVHTWLPLRFSLTFINEKSNKIFLLPFDETDDHNHHYYYCSNGASSSHDTYNGSNIITIIVTTSITVVTEQATVTTPTTEVI